MNFVEAMIRNIRKFLFFFYYEDVSVKTPFPSPWSALRPLRLLILLGLLVLLPVIPAGAQGSPDPAPLGPEERWSKPPARKLTAPVSLDDPSTDAQPLLKAPAPNDKLAAQPEAQAEVQPAPGTPDQPAPGKPEMDNGKVNGKGKNKDKAKNKDKDKGRKEKPEPAKPKPEVLPEPPVDAAAQPVLDYFIRVWTLDDTFPQLFARGPREHEAQSFGKLQAMQKGRGVFERFRKAYVDTKGLTLRVLEKDETRAKVRVTGTLLVLVGGITEEEEEGDDFTLIQEDGQWKILERVEVK